ncbi:DUF433 domain-containing protein [Arundinibacter roseus]|uniref:DUF433 domain-containing protein n=1 Tax=Arundinibacter roseus TaxID=2070510 RepID=A0A4R4KDE4_9BACT|nr:DUF433 domain-containing protein [Arundinibacter roseus]TDB65927.1 DUF433 domain-containing protein [Arundinibacter roseus]
MKAKKEKSSEKKVKAVYSIPDIAAILTLPEGQVKRWLREFTATAPSSSSELSSRKSDTVDFLTLIEFYTYFQLRQLGVGPAKINNARSILSGMMHTIHPFATANILTDGKNIFYNAEVGQLIKADQTLQLSIQQVVEPFCKRIEFGDDALPVKLYPLGRESAIQIDPNRQAGRPVVGDTEILSQTVFDLFLHGSSVSQLAEQFSLTERQVEDVILFHEK